jgi:hypothetical protein
LRHVVRFDERDRRDGRLLLVECDQRVEAHIREFVATDHDERIVAEKRFHRLDGSGTAHQLLFVQVREVDAILRTVTEGVLDLVGQIVHVDRNVLDAERFQIPQEMRAIGFSGDWNERLRDFSGQRIEPRAHPTGQDHGFHVNLRVNRVDAYSRNASKTKYGKAS